MGEKWRLERDARVKEQERRRTVYTSETYHLRMIEEIKKPLKEAAGIILNPDAGKTEKFKALLKLRRALGEFEQFPEPQEGIHPITGLPYVWNPNSLRLIHIRDEFFRHCHLDTGYLRLLRLIINFIIVLYDYDPPYRMMIDWWAGQLNIQNWDYSVPITVIARDWSSWWKE